MRERSHVRNAPPTEKALRPWTPEAAGRKAISQTTREWRRKPLKSLETDSETAGAARASARRLSPSLEGRCDVSHRWQVGEGVEPAVLGNALRGPHEAAVDPRGSPPSAELVSS
jgi:hypothetical protein